jgi:hypothetical protein
LQAGAGTSVEGEELFGYHPAERIARGGGGVQRVC